MLTLPGGARKSLSIVFIDPDNRFTLGCSGHNAQLHGEKCTAVGWSTEKTREACGWDAPPPEQEMLPGIDYESIVAANDTFEKLSVGLIPAPLGYYIVMLGSTHTVVYLRQVTFYY